MTHASRVVSDVEISFFTSGSEAEVLGLLESLHIRVDRAGGSGWFARLSALPRQLESEPSYYLRLEAHPLMKSADRFHYVLKKSLMPQKPPPREVREMSDQAGGMDGLLSNLASRWPHSKSLDCELKARFLLSAKQWESALFGKLPRASIRANGTVAEPDSVLVTWRIDEPAGRVSAFNGGADQLAVTTEIDDFKLDFGENMFDRVEAVVWEMTNGFVFAKTTKPKRRKTGAHS